MATRFAGMATNAFMRERPDYTKQLKSGLTGDVEETLTNWESQAKGHVAGAQATSQARIGQYLGEAAIEQANANASATVQNAWMGGAGEVLTGGIDAFGKPPLTSNDNDWMLDRAEPGWADRDPYESSVMSLFD